MNIAIPRWLVPWLVGSGLVSIALALVVTVRAYIQLRRAGYYVVREQARRTALRASLAVFVFILLTIGSLFIPRRSPTLKPTAVPATITPQQPHAPTPAFVPPTATTTSTPKPTATAPFIPTLTPQATLPITFTTPFPSAVPPPGDARFEFWTLAQGVDKNNRPVNPSSQFPARIERVYLFFRYDGLLSNIPWTTIWYQDGEILSGGVSLWESRRPAGERHVFLTLDGGYAVGEYEVQIWLGDRLQIRTTFSVLRAEG